MNTLFEEYNNEAHSFMAQSLRQHLDGGWGIGIKELQQRFEKKVVKEKKRGITSERQSVLKEIADTIKAESGAVNVKLLAIKLAHIPTPDLYFMLSEGKDYRNRTGNAFGKYIYGSVKIKK